MYRKYRAARVLAAAALLSILAVPAIACDAALQLQGGCGAPLSAPLGAYSQAFVQPFTQAIVQPQVAYAAPVVAQPVIQAYAAPVAAVRVRHRAAVVAAPVVAPVVATARVRVQKSHLSLFRRRVAVGAEAVVAAPY